MLLGDFLPYCYQHLAGIRNAAPGFKEIQMKPAFELEEVGFIPCFSHYTLWQSQRVTGHKSATGYSWEISVPANSNGYYMAAQCGYLRPHRKRKAIEAIRRFTNTPPGR